MRLSLATLVLLNMRRSAKVTAPLLAATAIAILSGCRGREMQRCVDENNRVVDDSFCANLPADNGQQYQNIGGGGSVPYRPIYHYYYGGRGGYVPGTLVLGGSDRPVPGHTYVSSKGVSTSVRGGFGRTLSGGGSGSEGGVGE